MAESARRVVTPEEQDSESRPGLVHVPKTSAIRWRSPIRGPWLTSVFGLILLVGVPIEFVTGLLSYAAYNPQLAPNDPNPHHGILGGYLFDWVTRPIWLYQFIEGLHVMLGLALVPIVLAKLWSVIPKLFARPAVRSFGHLLERASLVLLVGGVVFEFSTGILNINYFGAYGFSFYTGHFYGAWIFIAGFAVHIVLKFGRMVRALRSRRFRTELRTGLADTRPEPMDDGLVATQPAAPTISRRGALALVGATSLTVIALTAGETIGGGWRRLALFGTRGGAAPGVGPNHFPVNHTAASVGIRSADAGPAWRLELVGPRPVSISRDQLLSMPLTTADIPIACTEGWSTVQRWTGVSLSDLATLVGSQQVAATRLESLDGGVVTLSGTQVRDPDSMLALRVNGADLSLDHGYPARVMVPATPGTHNLKWMRRITFTEEAA
jgi:DMSO/TMAO reductase YedYZ molybdopterin-dependent catalytic subunit